MTIETHIDFELERIARITQHLPREDIEQLLFKLVGNFLQRESVYAQIITGLRAKEHNHD
jgi:alcohol dehydrogenase YqhD (iron-dependent ADH family)